MSLIRVSNQGADAVASAGEGPPLEPIEGLAGWALSMFAAEGTGVDRVVLTCEPHAEVNPLHSGGDVHWLGYVAAGSLELMLGDADGNVRSSVPVRQGDTLEFEPDTYHGWRPGAEPATLVFIKTSG